MRGAIVAAASLSVLLIGAQMVRADQITTTTVQQQTTTPSTMPLIPVQPDARSTFIYGSTSPGTGSVSTIQYSQFGGAENYARRLSLMADQINLGLQRGYIDQSGANALLARHAELASLEQQVAANGFTKIESDDLEKRMNVFNVDISHALGEGIRTAGAGALQ